MATSLLVVVVLVMVAAVTPPFAGGHFLPDKMEFYKQYAKYKVLSDCFGNVTVSTWYSWLDDIMEECRGEHDHGGSHVGQKVSSSMYYYSADKIRAIKDRTKAHVMFVNCTMNKMNITMTPNGGVDTKPLVEYYRGLLLDSALKKDLTAGVEKCGAASQCSDPRSYGPIDAAFLKKVEFLKCEQEVRLVACIRKDLRAIKGQFEMEGLDGVLDELEDDEDKMMAILTAQTSMDHSDIFI